jgi:hypothetical protein
MMNVRADQLNGENGYQQNRTKRDPAFADPKMNSE